mmetsp:Transcript_41259/g.92933  ORF Transcript_41259/g.92933 Transcript_41259/m.92933 type:complete len:200 (+) Transcript_41259:928-1527(+)
MVSSDVACEGCCFPPFDPPACSSMAFFASSSFMLDMSTTLHFPMKREYVPSFIPSPEDPFSSYISGTFFPGLDRRNPALTAGFLFAPPELLPPSPPPKAASLASSSASGLKSLSLPTSWISGPLDLPPPVVPGADSVTPGEAGEAWPDCPMSWPLAARRRLSGERVVSPGTAPFGQSWEAPGAIGSSSFSSSRSPNGPS